MATHTRILPEERQAAQPVQGVRQSLRLQGVEGTDRPDGAVHERAMRMVRSTSGSITRVVGIPPVTYGALGSPGAIRWIIRDGEVSMEVVE